jgi:uncharacterized protein YkwD
MQQQYSCANCGALVVPGNRFCTCCGAELNWPTAQMQHPQSQIRHSPGHPSRQSSSAHHSSAHNAISILAAFLLILCIGAGIGFTNNWSFLNIFPSQHIPSQTQQTSIVSTSVDNSVVNNYPAPQVPPLTAPVEQIPVKKDLPAGISLPPATNTPPASSAPGIQIIEVPASRSTPSPPQATPNSASQNPPANYATTTIKPQINIPELEQQVHNLVNSERQKNGLPPLSWDSQLNLIARKHSSDMAARNYFDHLTTEGLNPGDRYKQANYIIRAGWAENIFKCPMAKVDWYHNGVLARTEYYQPGEIASVIVTGWMNSPGHRANILTTNLTLEGIGVAISSTDDIYITEDFA